MAAIARDADVGLSGMLLTGWLTCLGVNQWRHPYMLTIDKSGLSLTIRGKTRVILWQDVSGIG